jgi:hypothetical protein
MESQASEADPNEPTHRTAVWAPRARDAASGASARAEVEKILARSPFKEATSQLDFESYRRLLVQEIGPETFMEHVLIKDVARLQVMIDRWSRAASTHLALASDAAAREIASPGFDNQKLGTTEMKLSTIEHDDFLRNAARDVLGLDKEQVMAKARQVLAGEGLSSDGIHDVAYMLRLPVLDQLEKLLAIMEARRDRLYADALHLAVNRRKQNLATPPLDCEFEA